MYNQRFRKEEPTLKLQIAKNIYLGLFLCLLSRTLHADTCFSSFENDTAKSGAIFIGKVVDIRPLSFWYFGVPKSVYTFEISESFKGLDEYDSYISIIGPVGGCCMGNFFQDSIYMVFAYGKDFLFTNDCSCTDLLSRIHGYREFLKPPILHNKAPWQLDRLKTEFHLRDSLLLHNEELTSDLQVSKEKVQIQRDGLIVFAIVIILLLSLLAYKLFVKNSNPV